MTAQWLSNDVVLLPYAGGYGEPEPEVQLPMGWDNHIYREGPVVKAVDLLVVAKSPSAGVSMSKRLIRSNPQIRAILRAIRNEAYPLLPVEAPKTFPILKEVAPVW